METVWKFRISFELTKYTQIKKNGQRKTKNALILLKTSLEIETYVNFSEAKISFPAIFPDFLPILPPQ